LASNSALSCLHAAIAEAQRLLGLDETAPVAVVSDNGSAFKAPAFAQAFSGDDPLLRHVRTRVRSPQTNGVVERFFGTLKYDPSTAATSATATPSPATDTSTTPSDPAGLPNCKRAVHQARGRCGGG
jgi:transposase InsO family protein